MGVFMPDRGLPPARPSACTAASVTSGGLDEALLVDRALGDAEIKADLPRRVAGTLPAGSRAVPDLAVNDIDRPRSRCIRRPSRRGGLWPRRSPTRARAGGRPFDADVLRGPQRQRDLRAGRRRPAGRRHARVTGRGRHGRRSRLRSAASSSSPGNIIHAFADSGGVVVESDETNNYASSAPPCVPPPPSNAPFAPVLEWSCDHVRRRCPTTSRWRRRPRWPTSTATASPRSSSSTLLDRRRRRRRSCARSTGARATTSSPLPIPTHRVTPRRRTSPSGDIDGDGRPEIVAVAASTHEPARLRARRHLQVEERRPRGASASAAPALADLDGDGTPEIVIGRQVLNANGTLRWTRDRRAAANRLSAAQLSLVADLDLDGHPEVVAGNTAYRRDGTDPLAVAGVPDGYNAVANFDADPQPEVVVVGGGQRLAPRAHGRHQGWMARSPFPGGGERRTADHRRLRRRRPARDRRRGRDPLHRVRDRTARSKWAAITQDSSRT